MDWKEFFKPDRKIIVVFVILLAITVFSFISVNMGPICENAPCPQPFPHGNPFFTAIYYILALPFVLLGKIVSTALVRPLSDSFGVTIASMKSIFDWLAVLLNVVYLYLTSCLISYLLTKFKK